MKKVTLANWDSHRYEEGRGKQHIYAEPYRNMPTEQRRKIAANIASNNGKCWWVHRWIYYNFK
tara:strand:+ start:810 stop:998 length:189 start_codon:yes stop_codon:yes gene_type:complete